MIKDNILLCLHSYVFLSNILTYVIPVLKPFQPERPSLITSASFLSTRELMLISISVPLPRFLGFFLLKDKSTHRLVDKSIRCSL